MSGTGTCGEGAGEYALVYVQSCSTNVGDGGSGAAVAAHELLHSLGAVQSAAKHECPAPDTQHACDSSYDVMYPYISGPIDSLFLDVGRDDYYGVGGAFDVRKSPWLARLDVPARPVNVSTLGSGRVVSDAGGIDCPGACATSQEQGLLVMLTAKPQKGSRFAGWSGACRGRGKCYVTVGKRSAVRARFISVRSTPRG